MEQLLKVEIIGILNAIQRGNAPVLTENETIPRFVETSEYKFDLVDSKDGLPIKEFETGTAHYINGNEDDTYNLKIICYDDFIHQFSNAISITPPYSVTCLNASSNPYSPAYTRAQVNIPPCAKIATC